MTATSLTHGSSREHSTTGFTGAFLIAAWLLATMSLWFFAFYSLPEGTPVWIRRAQVACFGSDDSGLPGPAGWMVLVLSPLGFLGAILVALGDEVSHGFRVFQRSGFGKAILLCVFVAVSGQAVWIGGAIHERLALPAGITDGAKPYLLPANYPRGFNKAPDFTLINQAGRDESLSAFAGKPVVLSFVFAHCATVCPTLVKTIDVAAASMGTERAHFMLVTLDPWRDTPAALPGLATQWQIGSNVSLLSGDPAAVTSVLDAFNIARQRDEKTGDVAHPAIVYVLSPGGEIAYTFNDPTPAWIEEAVQRVS